MNVADSSKGGVLLARLQMLTAALLFSTGGAAIKGTDMTSWQVAGFRSGIAAVVLWFLLPPARRALGAALDRRREGGLSPGRLAAVSAAYAAMLVLFVLGNKLTTAANTIFLQSTAPLYILLLAPWLLKEPVRRRDLVYMAVLAAGLGLFFVDQRAPDALAPDPFLGNVMGALAGLAWGLTLLGLRGLGRGVAATPGRDAGAAAVVVGNGFAFLVCLPLAVPVMGATVQDWGVVTYLGVVQVALAYVFLTRAFRRLGAFEGALLLLVEPVVNPVWAWVILGEVPGVWGLAGGAVILTATAVKTVWDWRRAAGRG